MKIGVDIDDTLINTKEQQIIYWKKYVTENPKTGYSLELPQTINDFGDEYVQNFWDIYREELSFRPTFKENASTVLNKLKKEGYTICVVTSRPDEKYDDLHKILKDWFQKNDIPIDYIFTNIREKATFCKEQNIDILIDDSILHCENCKLNNVQSILFRDTTEYNGLKTTDWNEIYTIIHNLQQKNDK